MAKMEPLPSRLKEKPSGIKRAQLPPQIHLLLLWAFPSLCSPVKFALGAAGGVDFPLHPHPPPHLATINRLRTGASLQLCT